MREDGEDRSIETRLLNERHHGLTYHSGLSTSWTSHRPHHKQGPKVYVSILPSAHKIVGSEAKNEYVLPSTDERLDRSNEQDFRRFPQSLYLGW